MEPSKIWRQPFAMPWDIKSEDPSSPLNKFLLPSNICLIEENPNTAHSHVSTDEDCLHKASGQSDSMENKEHNLTTNAANPVQKKPNKKQSMLANADIRRWYLNLAKTSQGNADVSLRRLRKFCEDHEITPMQFIELAQRDIKTATDLLADHMEAMEEHGNAPNYQKKMLDSLKSWMEHFALKPSRKIKIRNISSTPTLEDERVPEGNELAEIFNRCSLRAGATASFLSKGGLRPQVLGNDDASDGLTMKDLPDIAIVQGVAVCLQSPPMVIVRKKLSKARHQYFTFLTSQATKKLIAYLNDRIANGEALTADSPVIAPDHRHKYGGRYPVKKFIKSARISHIVRETFRPRFTWRPYVLRAYFDTQLLIAESKGKVAHDFRVFWMGHKGSIEAVYTTNKGRIPESLQKEMREAFQRCEEFLDLEVREDDPLKKQKGQLHTEIENAPPDKVQEILRILGSANPASDGGNK